MNKTNPMDCTALLAVGDNTQQDGRGLLVHGLPGLDSVVELHQASSSLLAKQLLEDGTISLDD